MSVAVASMSGSPFSSTEPQNGGVCPLETVLAPTWEDGALEWIGQSMHCFNTFPTHMDGSLEWSGPKSLNLLFSTDTVPKRTSKPSGSNIV